MRRFTLNGGKCMRGIRVIPAVALLCLVCGLSIASAAVESSGAGTLDRSFGDRGKVLTRFKHRHGRQSFGHPNLVPRAYSVLIDSNNRAVAIGTADEKFALVRNEIA